MQVISERKISPTKDSNPIFYGGEVTSQPLVGDGLGTDFNFNIVNFSPGAKNQFHTHTSDQILYVIRGKGIIATNHEEVEITVGDTAFIPSGERHWHGATDESHFSHIALLGRDNKTAF